MKHIALGVMTLMIPLVSLSAVHTQQADNTTGCENLVKYMHEARKIAREFKNPERKERLLELKGNYAEKLRDTSKNARRAAAQWIAALDRADQKIKSGKMEDSAVFDVLRFRNWALGSCGFNAEEVGFRSITGGTSETNNLTVDCHHGFRPVGRCLWRSAFVCEPY
ncbi:MAG TPA: hypothetical protein VK463_11775 [Desulfomonilaceae bacterium]|nr:hypothetical protein [Desulfomonilaceae bacterium]